MSKTASHTVNDCNAWYIMTALLLLNFLQNPTLSCTSDSLQPLTVHSHRLLCVQPMDSGKCNTAKSCTEYSHFICSVGLIIRENVWKNCHNPYFLWKIHTRTFIWTRTFITLIKISLWDAYWGRHNIRFIITWVCTVRGCY